MSVRMAIVAAGAAVLAGCAGIKDHKGYVFDKELAASVQPGVDNKDSVARTLGRPTFTGTFGADDWYYVSRDTHAFAFRNPRPAAQTVLRVRFDQAGNVAQVERTGVETVMAVAPMHAKTPTLGRKRGFFEELFRGVGTIGTGIGGVGTGSGGNPGD